MTVPEINTVCFVGAGTMGCYNSLVAAISGYQVVLYDRSQEVLDTVAEQHLHWGPLLVAGGYCSDEMLSDGLQRVSITSSLQSAVADADLVSESIFEQREAKRETHARLDEVCPERTVLTTNSSTLLVSDLEDALSRGDRFAALHSHLGSPLFDIVAGSQTRPEVITLLARYVMSLRGVPLVQHKEHRGYVLNAMIGALLRAALELRIERGFSADEVDRAWMNHQSASMGPFGMMDLFGLNVIYDSWTQARSGAHQQALQHKVLALLQPFLDEGRLGAKSGEGFYRYPRPAYQADDFLSAESAVEEARDTLLVALISHGVLVAARGVTERGNVDLAWRIGTQLPAGPFLLLEQMGVEAYQSLLADYLDSGQISAEDVDVISAYLKEQVKTA